MNSNQTTTEGTLAPPIVMLTATLPGRQELLGRAMASMCAQKALPDHAVIVADGEWRSNVTPSSLARPSIDVHCLVNQGAPGAANSWNTGIEYAARRWPDCYIAMLDDDDEWDPDHLATCKALAQSDEWPEVVLSGLRMIQDGLERARPPIQQATEPGFLAGNPGWQGSNTFIRLSTLLRVGGFTRGLASCNDRDLAIRVLALGDVRIAFTGRHTVSWHLDSSRETLSSSKNPEKLEGLAHFYSLHGHRMTPDIRQAFFGRAETLFGWRQEDVVRRAMEYGHADNGSVRD